MTTIERCASVWRCVCIMTLAGSDETVRTVDIKRDIDAFGLSKGRRPGVAGMQIEHPINNNTSNTNNNNKVAAADVKTERLSPAAAGDSASSRSGTPSSSYPGTPPGSAAAADRVASPAPNPLNRNCSDLIRSLAAKYQNANSSEYSSSRNGLHMGFLSTAGKEHGDNLLHPAFPFLAPTIPGTSVPMFPPMMDMSSTQALLSMVRSSQIDAFMSKTGGATKRSSSSSSSSSNPHLPSEQNPLDLSSSGSCKKPRKSAGISPWDGAGSFADTFLNIPAFSMALQKSREKAVGGNGKRLGSVSPKPAKSSSKPSASGCQAAASRTLPCVSSCSTASATTTSDKHTCPNTAEKSAVAAWTVDDVCDFVNSIDLCAEYSQRFRDQSVDGTALPLLSEDHLTGTMNMKLGPALKFRAVLAQKLGNCVVCMHCAHCHGAQPHVPRTTPSPSNSS
ncbi:polycomb protein Scm-like isoform X2 [Daktulosphaira vitifoliae]|uniref:polycomb protein Scm-like isoform X2 n=1 Tax=Daktulosphaira vitifoliae TaxID=58002 RepID=UPI0021AAAEFE|nr:polycomb protein Scm-like isoform X2 [Daktulosphaira vitifoliae]